MMLTLFYLQVLAGETVPKGFWGCYRGKTLIGITSPLPSCPPR